MRTSAPTLARPSQDIGSSSDSEATEIGALGLWMETGHSVDGKLLDAACVSPMLAT